MRGASDAALLAAHTFVPAIVWAAIWTLLGISLLGWAMYKSLHAPSRPSQMRMPPLTSARRS
jgi:hypothetical protein